MEFKRIIAIAERSAGNEQVGDMWLETKSFDKNVCVEEIINWYQSIHAGGKLIITIDQDSYIKNEPL